MVLQRWSAIWQMRSSRIYSTLFLMRIAGENGVAAITIILYAQFLFNSLYLGFSIGVAPVIGFQYGAKNRDQLKSLYKYVIAL